MLSQQTGEIHCEPHTSENLENIPYLVVRVFDSNGMWTLTRNLVNHSIFGHIYV